MSSTKTIDFPAPSGLIKLLYEKYGQYTLRMTTASSPPSKPAVGDVWAEEDGDTISFYVWDGFIWRDVFVGDPNEPEAQKVEVDTPEKAYDRAMGVVR